MLNTQIQTYFIEHLAATHGNPPKDTFADELAARFEGKTFTNEHLHSAAEKLVQTIRSKTFPSFSVCLEAIRNHTPFDPTLGHQKAGIKPEDYVTRACEYAKRHGWHVLNNKTPNALNHRDQIEAWLGYFEWKGIPHQMFKSQMASGGEITVPAPYPWEFDLECPPSIGTGGRQREEKIMQQLSPEQRAAIVERALKRTRTEDASRRAAERNHRKVESREELDRKLEQFKTMPIDGISSELASRFLEPEEMPF